MATPMTACGRGDLWAACLLPGDGAEYRFLPRRRRRPTWLDVWRRQQRLRRAHRHGDAAGGGLR